MLTKRDSSREFIGEVSHPQDTPTPIPPITYRTTPREDLVSDRVRELERQHANQRDTILRFQKDREDQRLTILENEDTVRTLDQEVRKYVLKYNDNLTRLARAGARIERLHRVAGNLRDTNKRQADRLELLEGQVDYWHDEFLKESEANDAQADVVKGVEKARDAAADRIARLVVDITLVKEAAAKEAATTDRMVRESREARDRNLTRVNQLERDNVNLKASAVRVVAETDRVRRVASTQNGRMAAAREFLQNGNLDAWQRAELALKVLK